MPFTETQLTAGPGGRILTNTAVWSPDGEWVVFDTRSDAAGDRFDGTRIEAVHVRTKRVRVLYESRHGANCGVATWHPHRPDVVFILGPERPTPDWGYGPTRRQGVIVNAENPGVAVNLDARDLTPPFTPGALRGGSHVHVFSPDGGRVSFTYEDEVLAANAVETPAMHKNLRGVAFGVPGDVRVSRGHPRNHDGIFYCALVTRLTANPAPGSDEISRAFEDGWVGSNALAFQGLVASETGEALAEVFLVEGFDDLRTAGDTPLEGTQCLRPAPPLGCVQRRLTRTAGRKFPGVRGPRHWVRANAAGTRIGFFMHDDRGVPQLWTVPPSGGEPSQVSDLEAGVMSAFSWHPAGDAVAVVSGGRVAMIDVKTGTAKFVTAPGGDPIRPEACVVSPDGTRVAFVRRVGEINHICVAALD